jgi:hypothetical protein
MPLSLGKLMEPIGSQPGWSLIFSGNGVEYALRTFSESAKVDIQLRQKTLEIQAIHVAGPDRQGAADARPQIQIHELPLSGRIAGGQRHESGRSVHRGHDLRNIKRQTCADRLHKALLAGPEPVKRADCFMRRQCLPERRLGFGKTFFGDSGKIDAVVPYLDVHPDRHITANRQDHGIVRMRQIKLNLVESAVNDKAGFAANSFGKEEACRRPACIRRQYRSQLAVADDILNAVFFLNKPHRLGFLFFIQQRPVLLVFIIGCG